MKMIFRSRFGVSIAMTSFVLLLIAIIYILVASDALEGLICLLPAALLLVFPIVHFLVSPSVYFESLSGSQTPTRESMKVAKDIEAWLDDDEELLAFTVGTLKSFPSIQILALTNKYLRIGSDIGDRDVEINKITRVSWSPIKSILRIDLSIPPNKLEFEVNGREWKRRTNVFSSAWNEIVADA